MKGICFIFLWPLLVLGQPPQPKDLSVGTLVPNLELNNIINYKSPSARLSDFKGKGLILDFWATWCTSCLISFPKLDSLQKKYGDRLQVLLVTQQPAAVAKTFFKKNKIAAATSLASVTSDTLLSALFPHRAIPHTIWIDASGSVKAITDSKHLTEANIRRFLEGTLTGLPLKKDIMDFNPSLPLLEAGNGGEGPYLSKTVWAGHLPGLGRMASQPQGDTYKKLVTINQPALLLYQLALDRSFNNRVVLEVKDPTKYLADTLDSDYWQSCYTWCYELTIPLATTKEEIRQKMRRDLDAFFGTEGRMEMRRMKCLALVRTGAKELLATKGGEPLVQNSKWEPVKRFQNQPLSKLVEALNRQPSSFSSRQKPIIIDETGFTGHADIEVTMSFDPVPDLARLRKELLQYGLELAEVVRELEVFVLTEKTFDRERK